MLLKNIPLSGVFDIYPLKDKVIVYMLNLEEVERMFNCSNSVLAPRKSAKIH